MWWLVYQVNRRALRRLALAAVAVALPVAVFASTLLFIDDNVSVMTNVALQPVQVEMRALATSLQVDMPRVARDLRSIPHVQNVDLFGSADVVVGTPGANSGRVSARLYGVPPAYFGHHEWVRANGDVTRGVLLNGAVAASAGLGRASRVTIELRGDTSTPAITLPVTGRVDVRDASTWYAIPAGAVQGDIAVVPRVIVVSYDTFSRLVLPQLLRAFGPATVVTNPGLSELPPASIEAHVAVDHHAYPPDPGQAVNWSARMRRVLERRAPGDIVVADNTAEPLTEASVDATNAKTLFLLLGIPGALVAGALGLAGAAALSEANRREDALLRLRGATDAQLVRLSVNNGILAGTLGTALGLAVAVVAVSLVIGHGIWSALPTSQRVVVFVAAIVAGAITTLARLIPLIRAGRRSSLAVERRALPGEWRPAWRRSRLDVAAFVVGLTILAGNILAGGLKPLPVQGAAVALSFYVLLAPIALWLGLALLAVRGLLVLLARRSRPDRPRPLTSWRSAAARWTSRRPALPAIALTLGILAVAFGTEVVTFVSTYRDAKHNDARAAIAADLRLTPATDPVQPLPALGPDIAATTPIRFIPARSGSDRKTIMAVDLSSYRTTATMSPQILRGEGLDALARDRSAIVVSDEIARDFAVAPGDTLPVTIYPDDLDLSQKMNFHVVGVYRAFPPNDPFSEMVMSAAGVPAPVQSADMWLARVARGRSVDAVAAELRRGPDSGVFAVSTITDLVRKQQRTLTALNLGGLGRIEAVAGVVVAALGVGVLGAFIVLERRREFALLRTLGADTRAVLTGPLLEGALTTFGSLLIGLPLGVLLSILSVRVLGLFFNLPPPVVRVPLVSLVALSVAVVALSAGAFAVALRRVSRLDVASLLREQ